MAFAETTDVEARLGRSFAGSEEAMAGAALDAVSSLIAAAAGKAEDDIDPVPAYLKWLAVEKVVSLLRNPEGVASMSKTLGAVQESKTYPRASDIGIFLSDREESQVRFYVFGSDRSTFRVPSLIDDLYDAFYPPI